MDTILELAKFNHIKYYDEPHKYYIDVKPTISCTGFSEIYVKNLYKKL